jgi:hypothetical protein
LPLITVRQPFANRQPFINHSSTVRRLPSITVSTVTINVLPDSNGKHPFQCKEDAKWPEISDATGCTHSKGKASEENGKEAEREC